MNSNFRISKSKYIAILVIFALLLSLAVGIYLYTDGKRKGEDLDKQVEQLEEILKQKEVNQ